MQLIVRGVLGLINGYGLIHLRHTAEATCNNEGQGKKIGYLFMAFQAVQFHVIFYASRTLPNMFAFPLTNFAISQVLYDNFAGAITLLSFSAIVFRAELIVFAGAVALTAMILKKLPLAKTIVAGIRGVLTGAIVSVVVDSFFWQKAPMIPEVTGFIFNVVYGKSEMWGVEPIHAYFSNHIPNMITNPVLLGVVPAGAFLDPTGGKNTLRALALASMIFVAIYSLQPHKEWRFIVYIMPIFSLLAANGTMFMWVRQHRAVIYKIMPLLLLLSTVAGMGMSLAKLGISQYNYPGGTALKLFHNTVNVTEPVTVHLDVPVCMTGASRFGEINPLITYDKTEDANKLQDVWTTFDYLITSYSTADAFPTVENYSWEQIGQVNGFQTLNGPFINDQIEAMKADAGKYVEDLVWTIRTTNGIRQDLAQLWDHLIIQKPKVFIYQRVAAASA